MADLGFKVPTKNKSYVSKRLHKLDTIMIDNAEAENGDSRR